MTVKLKKDEFDLLTKGPFLSAELLAKVQTGFFDGKTYTISMSNEEASLIREACGEELQTSGFDALGEPTKRGLVNEDLVDEFFTG